MEDSEDETPMTEEYSRERNAIARGKRPVESMEDEEEEDVQPQSKGKTKLSTEELYKIFKGMIFAGTRFPHPATMKKLGIKRDVEFLFEMCHLDTFMKLNMEAYEDETCYFLASLKVHFYEDEPDYISDGGLGFITFTIRNKHYSLTFKEIDHVYGFPSGTGVIQDIEKRELLALWETIGGNGTYSSSRSKSAQIRSPVLRYLHKSIASTLFARKVTGNINEGELQMLDLAIEGVLNTTRDGTVLVGDRADTSLTHVMIDQMLYYQDWAIKLHRKGSTGELSIGGIVTPILVACGVELISKEYAPRWLDIPHLTRTHFLDFETVNGLHLYKFVHPSEGAARMILPNTRETKVRTGFNIDFWPSTDILYVHKQENFQQEEEQEEEQEDEDEVTEFEPKPFHFQEYATDSRQSQSLKEAHKHVSILQKWNKFQDKTIKTLKNTVKELSSSMSHMKDQIKELQDKVVDSSSKKSKRRSDKLRRSSSLRMEPREEVPIEPPRSSAAEPRQRRKRAGREKRRNRNDSSSRLDQALEPQVESVIESLVECSTDHTHDPSYTKDTMDALVTSYFTNP